jgi:DNA modification methylase
MPWRVTHALQDDGWIVRNAVIWHKPNAAPFPSRDRLTCRYETLFLLVKQPDYFFDPTPVHQPSDVWTVPVTPRRHRTHPAAFPIDIPLRCITAGCPPHGSVLDPFSGTGTTGQAAARLHRPYTGIDLNPAFNHQARAHLGGLPFCSATGRISGPPAGPTSCLSPVPPPQPRGPRGG